MPTGRYTRRVYDLQNHAYKFVNWVKRWDGGGYEPKMIGELLLAGFKENA